MEKTELPKKTYPVPTAWAMAQRLQQLLSPFTHRVEVAGALRTGSTAILGINIVVVPHTVWRQEHMFLQKEVPSTDFYKMFDGWELVKGNIHQGYRGIFTLNGVPISVTIANKYNLGLQMMMQTGPYEWKKYMVRALSQRRYKIQDGHLYKKVKKELIYTEVPEEDAVFEIMKIKPIAPELRYDFAKKKNEQFDYVTTQKKLRMDSTGGGSPDSNNG